MQLHVTDVLVEAGFIDVRWFTDEGRDRGTAVHRAIELFLEGTLDWGSMEIRTRKRVEQFGFFMEEADVEILAVEEPVEHPLGFKGTLDLRVLLNGAEGIIDIKPLPAAWHPLQLAAYARCFDRPMKRWNLYLQDDRYWLSPPHTDRNDWYVFRAALTIVQWRVKHSCTKTELRP